MARPDHADAASVRYWSATIVPIVARDGEVGWLLVHAVDVTALYALMAAREGGPSAADRGVPDVVAADLMRRAQAVQATNRDLGSELRDLRLMFNQAPGFMCFLGGSDHVFELANTAFVQLVGHRRIIGEAVRDAFPELVGQPCLGLLDEVFERGSPFVGRSLEVTLQRVAGGAQERRCVDFVFQPIVGRAGRVRGIFVQGNDITEQSRLQAERSTLVENELAALGEAEQAVRFKDELLATVGHELRTPLTSMLGWVQQLRVGTLSAEERDRALEIIERNGWAQSKCIDDLLDVRRFLSGTLPLAVESTDVSAAVRAVVESLRLAADARGIAVHLALDPSAHALCDRARLQQILWNLLSNALKFTPTGGSVELVVATAASSVEIVVSDTGRGIAADFLPHISERFRQAEGSSTRRHGGLGLGLAIVKHLVELHGGAVTVESAGEGQESTFTVRLPLLADGHPSVARWSDVEALALAAERSLRGVRVVVVAGDTDTLGLLRALLERWGAVVDVADSAVGGLALLRRVRPGLLLWAPGGPDDEGDAFVRGVRALPPGDGGRTPSVAVTAHDRAGQRTRALLRGFNASVAKPIEPAELSAVLASLLLPREDLPG